MTVSRRGFLGVSAAGLAAAPFAGQALQGSAQDLYAPTKQNMASALYNAKEVDPLWQARQSLYDTPEVRAALRNQERLRGSRHFRDQIAAAVIGEMRSASPSARVRMFIAHQKRMAKEERSLSSLISSAYAAAASRLGIPLNDVPQTQTIGLSSIFDDDEI